MRETVKVISGSRVNMLEIGRRMTESNDLLATLDEDINAADLAKNASYSLAQFYRLVRRSLGGSPMAIRRRLLLERAAYRLINSGTSITEIAFEACYGSLEGFSRAFRQAYCVSPSKFRSLSPTNHRYGSLDGLHYEPINSATEVGIKMHTDELMIEHHVSHVGQLLAIAELWPEHEMDRPMNLDEPFPWFETKTSYRAMLGKTCGFAAPWMESISGIKTSYTPATIPEMRLSLERGKVWFLEFLKTVAGDNSWDISFVDGVCEPPEVFTYGGVIGHVLTHNAYRRYVLVAEFRRLGFKDLTFSDPLTRISEC